MLASVLEPLVRFGDAGLRPGQSLSLDPLGFFLPLQRVFLSGLRRLYGPACQFDLLGSGTCPEHLELGSLLGDRGINPLKLGAVVAVGELSDRSALADHRPFLYI